MGEIFYPAKIFHCSYAVLSKLYAILAGGGSWANIVECLCQAGLNYLASVIEGTYEHGRWIYIASYCFNELPTIMIVTLRLQLFVVHYSVILA